jgi:hypothetical protein
MNKLYKVVHSKSTRDSFPLSDGDIQREYTYFRQMVAHVINSSIKAECKKMINGVELLLEGDVTEQELDLAAEQILIEVNKLEVTNRVGHHNFVFTN